MVQNCPELSNWFKMVKNNSIWSNIVPKLPKIFLNALLWSGIVQNGSNGAKRFKMVQNGPEMVQNSPIWPKFIQNSFSK